MKKKRKRNVFFNQMFVYVSIFIFHRCGWAVLFFCLEGDVCRRILWITFKPGKLFFLFCFPPFFHGGLTNRYK